MLKRHTLMISYADSRGTRHSMDSVLDWESYTLGRRWINRKGIHHVGESVAKIEKSIGRLAKTAAGRGGPTYGDPAGLSGAAPATSQPADVEDLARSGFDTKTQTFPEDGTGVEAVAPVAENPRAAGPQTGTDPGDGEAQPNET